MGRRSSYQFTEGTGQPDLPAVISAGIHFHPINTVVGRIGFVVVIVVVHLRQDDETGGKRDTQSQQVQYAGGKKTPEGMRKISEKCVHKSLRVYYVMVKFYSPTFNRRVETLPMPSLEI